MGSIFTKSAIVEGSLPKTENNTDNDEDATEGTSRRSSLDTPNPTAVTDANWLYARNITTITACQTDEHHGGKWLIFEPASRIDKVWAEIKAATEQGRLGYSSTVETKKSKDEQKIANSKNSMRYTICVRTYDCADKEDAMRVREQLRDMGFYRKLVYTIDAGNWSSQKGESGEKIGRWHAWYC